MKLIKTMAMFLIMVLSFSYLSDQGAKNVKAEEKNPLKIEKIIGLSKEPGTFRKANGLAVAKDGTIFIGDSGESQIEVYDANYKYLRTIGSLGNGEDQFQWIQSIHLDEDENLYVLDGFLGCIKVFSKEGVFLRNIAICSFEEVQRNNLGDFSILASGEIIIEWKSSYRIFTKEGKFVRELEFRDENGYRFSSANFTSIDSDGNFFIGAYVNEISEFKFLKFNQSGEILGEFLKWQKKDRNDPNSPQNICIVGEDLFFSEGNSIKRYKLVDKGTKPATYIESIAEEIKGKTIDKTSVIDVSGLVCTNDKIFYLDSMINRVIVVSYKKEILGTIESSIKEMRFMYPNNEIPKNYLSLPWGITIGPGNLFYLVNQNLNKVSVYNSDWEEIASFGKPVLDKKKQPGELICPNDVAINRDGFIFVSDGDAYLKKECTIEVFDPEYKPFISIPISSETPMGMDFDSKGNLIVGKRGKGNLLIYDLSKLKEKKVIKKKEFKFDEVFFIEDVVMDKADNAIVSTTWSRQIFWINPDGKIINKIGSDDYEEKSPIQFPRGLCLDGKEDLYVVEQRFMYDSGIKKFAQNGELIWQTDWMWGGLFYIAMNSQGKLYVTDILHNVILVLSDSTAVPPVPKEPTLDESKAEFSFSVDKPDITEQETFTLSVNVDKLEHTAAIDLTIQYPKELLTFESCTLGDVLIDPVFEVPIIDQSTGFINIKSSSMDGKETDGSGVLFEVKLKAKRPGLAYLEYADIKLKNAEGNKVSYAGKKALSLVIKTRDTTPPPLTIKPCPSEVYVPILLIEGETEAGAKVTINQKEVVVDVDGKFSSKQELAKGSNTFLVEAVDKAGNKSNQTMIVTLLDRIIIELTVGTKTIIVNGKLDQLDSEPFIDKVSGRTMVPIRAIATAIGAKIEFSQDVRTISITHGPISVELRIGNPLALVNGTEVPIDQGGKVSPVIVKGRTFVPLRFVAETFEFKVDWDAKTQGITMTYPK